MEKVACGAFFGHRLRYEDFLTGFILDDGNAWARPVAAAVMNDGSLLMSEDGNDLVYRISYSR